MDSSIPEFLPCNSCQMDESGMRTLDILDIAVRKLSLFAPSHDRLLKVVRTIADPPANPKWPPLRKLAINTEPFESAFYSIRHEL